MQDPPDPVSGFLLLSIYASSPFLAPAADLLQGLLPVQILRGGQSHSFIPRSRLRSQHRALDAGLGVGVQGRGSASIPALWDGLGKFPIDLGSNSSSCYRAVSRTVAAGGWLPAPAPARRPGGAGMLRREEVTPRTPFLHLCRSRLIKALSEHFVSVCPFTSRFPKCAQHLAAATAP